MLGKGASTAVYQLGPVIGSADGFYEKVLSQELPSFVGISSQKALKMLCLIFGIWDKKKRHGLPV
jgi:hypothetical protein